MTKRISEEVAYQCILNAGDYPVEHMRKETVVMVEAINKLTEKYSIQFKSICKNIDINIENIESVLDEVSNETLDEVSWGCLITIFGLCTIIVKDISKQHHKVKSLLMQRVADWLMLFIGNYTYWIENVGGGWVSTVKYISVTKYH